MKNSAKNCPVYQTTAWPGDEAQQRDQGDLGVLPLAKRLRQRSLRTGAFVLSFSVKAGLSCICIRIQTEMTSRIADSRNGMRQPQASKSAGDIAPRTPTMISSESNSPSVAVVWMKLV